MSAFRTAPAGVFEIQRSSSFRAPPPSYPEEKQNGEVEELEESDIEEDEEEVDESVREDMTKLEDTFPGISDRFRLVNRIGEGMLE